MDGHRGGGTTATNTAVRVAPAGTAEEARPALGHSAIERRDAVEFLMYDFLRPWLGLIASRTARHCTVICHINTA